MVEYRKQFTLSPEHMDGSGNIKASHLLFLFQEIATEHAEHLGIGFQEMIRENLIWVIAKLRYCIQGRLQTGVPYELVTYPKPRRALSYQRDYYIFETASAAKEQSPVVAATSQWCILNYETRKIEQYDFDFGGETYAQDPFPDAYPRIRPKELVPAGVHTVTQTDLDENEHTNNCRYADMFYDAAGKNDGNEFCIHFQKETRPGDHIFLYKEEKEDSVSVIGKLESGETVFQAMTK